jgi:hypothetical protein
VHRWDDRELAGPRPVTERLAALFLDRSTNLLDP